nr:class I SAM-dependent methyltransferase [Nocardia bovistercoris]
MSALDYRIPELAKPFFEQQIREYRAATRTHAPTVLDIGCSYGVNAALLRLGLTIDELSEHYRAGEAASRAAMVSRDRARLAEGDACPDVRFIGMDAARPALDYANEAGLLHDIVHADLESADPTEAQRDLLASADIVISTGCVGYVTEKTLVRIATADPARRPWMAHFVLRMFDFAPIAAEFAALGYRTERVPGLFEQRRFASDDERAQVLNALSDRGIDTEGQESRGWLYAALYLSRPLPEPGAVEDRG